MSDVETIIASATVHGRDSEPDHEAGDLQDALRTAIKIMSTDELERLFRGDTVVDALDVADVEVPDNRPEPAEAFFQFLLDAAERHGSFEDPDHEIGDLQDILRAAWGAMSEASRAALMADEKVIENLAEWNDVPKPSA